MKINEGFSVLLRFHVLVSFITLKQKCACLRWVEFPVFLATPLLGNFEESQAPKSRRIRDLNVLKSHQESLSLVPHVFVISCGVFGVIFANSVQIWSCISNHKYAGFHLFISRL